MSHAAASSSYIERKGVAMTLRGARQEVGTLDLTNVRFSASQMAALVAIVFGLGGLWAVALWRINDIAERMARVEAAVTQLKINDSAQDAALRRLPQRP